MRFVYPKCACDTLFRILEKQHFFAVRKASIVTVTHKSFLNDVKGGNYMFVDVGVDVNKFKLKPETSKTLVFDSSKTESFGSVRNSFEFRHAQKFLQNF